MRQRARRSQRSRHSTKKAGPRGIRPDASGEGRLSRACPWRRPCRPCGSRSPIRCRTRSGCGTMLPSMTLVWSMWKIDECGSWLKSWLTSLLVGVAEDALERAVGRGADRVVDLFGRWCRALASKVRSTTETFGVGTRIATPSSLPSSSGSTRPTALAAPVEVGIMSAPRRGRGRGPCASCRASAGRRYRSGSSS